MTDSFTLPLSGASLIWRPVTAACTFLLLMLALSGCGRGSAPSSQAAGSPQPPVDLTAMLAALPPLPDGRGASASNVSLVWDGNDCTQRDLASTFEVGQTLQFGPPAGKAAWALYDFNVGASQPAQVSVQPMVGDRGVYIGVSDYAAGRWRFSGPFDVPVTPPAARLTAPLSFDSLSPQGHAYVVIVAAGAGAQAIIESVEVQVNNWQDGTMHLAAQNPGDPALAEIGGRPAVAYGSGGNVYFIRAAVASGASWDAPVLVGSGNGSPMEFSLAEIAGRPAIAFCDYDATDPRLLFYRANDATGSDWPTLPVVVGTSPDQFYGRTPSLASINGYTAIAFVSHTGGSRDLGFALNNADATDVWFTVKPYAGGLNVLGYCSLTTVNGHPAISYLAADLFSNEEVQYAYASSVNGALQADWTSLKVADAFSGIATGDTGLAVVNGVPAVAYLHDSGMKFAYADSPTGLGSWTVVPLQVTQGNVAGLMADNGRAAVLAVQYNPNQMVLLRALDASGATWSTPLKVAELSTTAYRGALVNGSPALIMGQNSGPSLLHYVYRP